ncbi:MAG: hypothetical protein F6K26_38985 [Moorea sp. SIO2I5]|nr:hypothetical protein [Moorena sp. SIO2I5]
MQSLGERQCGHGGDPQDRTASPRPRCIAAIVFLTPLTPLTTLLEMATMQ